MAWQAGTSSGGGHHKPQKRSGQVRAQQMAQQTDEHRDQPIRLTTDTASTLAAVPAQPGPVVGGVTSLGSLF